MSREELEYSVANEVTDQFGKVEIDDNVRRVMIAAYNRAIEDVKAKLNKEVDDPDSDDEWLEISMIRLGDLLLDMKIKGV